MHMGNKKEAAIAVSFLLKFIYVPGSSTTMKLLLRRTLQRLEHY